MEAETGVMLLQSEECQEPPEVGRGKDGPFPRAFKGSEALPTPPFLTSGLLDYERINSHYLEPHGSNLLWSPRELIQGSLLSSGGKSCSNLQACMWPPPRTPDLSFQCPQPLAPTLPEPAQAAGGKWTWGGHIGWRP